MSGHSENATETKSFEDIVLLDQELDLEGVMEIMREQFPDSTDNNIKDAFSVLKNAKEDSVLTFSKGVNNGNPCIKLKEKDGSYNLMYIGTGQPMAYCG